MVLSNVSNISQDQRIRNLLLARKKYSDYAKDQCKNGAKEKAALRLNIEQNQKEIIQIKEELEKYRREYNTIIKTMGRAHEDAVFQENEEDIVSDLIKQRNKRVKSRAELVLLEEVHRAKLLDLKKQLEKEKIIKRRRDIFCMRNPPPKVRINKEYQERLDEWKQFEELVQKEINQLREEKEQARLRRVQLFTNRNEVQLRPVKPGKVIPKVHLKPKIIANAQVQTSICIEPKEMELPLEDLEPESLQKVSSSSQVNLQFLPSTVLKPTKKINSNLENLLALRVAEKLNKMKQSVNRPVEVPVRITKDAAINTSCLIEEEQSISDLSQTFYLPLPGEKKKLSNSTREKSEKEQAKDISGEDDRESSTVDLSLMSGINLEDLVQKIQHIKNLVNKAEPAIKIQSIQLIKQPVIDKGDAVVSSTNQSVNQDKKNTSANFICEDQISPVSSISPSLSPTRSLSPTQSDSPPPSTPLSPTPPSSPSPSPSPSPLPSPPLSPGLSESSSSTSSDATIKKLNPQISLDDVSADSLPDHLTMEQGRFNDNSSSVILPRSFQASIDFSQFSQLLSVDKDKLWSDVLDLAGINKTTTFMKTPSRKTPRKFTQSTPKTRTSNESVVFNCLTNQVTIPN